MQSENERKTKNTAVEEYSGQRDHHVGNTNATTLCQSTYTYNLSRCNSRTHPPSFQGAPEPNSSSFQNLGSYYFNISLISSSFLYLLDHFRHLESISQYVMFLENPDIFPQGLAHFFASRYSQASKLEYIIFPFFFFSFLQNPIPFLMQTHRKLGIEETPTI